MERSAGILLHPTSLPGAEGIGTFGSEAYQFIDWSSKAGFSIWQVLPLGPTGYGDSPYQCFSAFAGNPLLISLRTLVEHGYLSNDDVTELSHYPREKVDFGRVIPVKRQLLEKACINWFESAPENERNELNDFRHRQGHWLEDYAMFMSLKDFYDGRCWNEWPEEHRDRHESALNSVREELSDRINRQVWLQYVFFKQWGALRQYANEKGIKILGDMPIFVAYDSSDAWANRTLFHFDETGNPSVIAGVPPDYFSETGQRWGNPLYNWYAHRSQGFEWWKQRIGTSLELVDLIRIDHFRGFSACWEIPASEPTAINGKWVDSPGRELFEAVIAGRGDLPLVAEDLGVITDDVTALRKQFNLPGMRVLQFAFGSGSDNPFLPHNHEPDSVVYSGTHDNNTSLGWWKEEATDEMKGELSRYRGHPVEEPHWDLIHLAFSSVAETAVVPMQDLLGLDSNTKMNRPGEASGNWEWRASENAFSGELADRVRQMLILFGRKES